VKRLVVPWIVTLLLVAGPQRSARPASRAASSAPSWQQAVAERIPLYGHRNWIVIADSAYPAQSSPGIETVVSDADHMEVVQAVLRAVAGSKHVRPIIYTDAELKYVSDSDAPGITTYREQLARVLGSRPVSVLPHEQIISKLDDAGKTFRVLIIKTNLTLPYTSVFLQLDCGYWSADAERRLREAMAR
jgi:L-fucose mutarotase/ribose pyranase (RbsD/FucU family)